MPVALAQVNRLTSANNEVLELLGRDLADVGASLDFNRPEAARDTLLTAAPNLATQYGELAGVAAAEWYEDVRRSEIGGTYTARLAAPPAFEAVEEDVRYFAAHLFTERPDATLDELLEAMSRKVLNVSQDTVSGNATRYDQHAAGWQRIARPDGCDFCVMLAQRGGVYKRDTADFASHNYCRCRIRPAWDPDLPEVEVGAYVASRRTAGMSDRERELHRSRVRNWINNHADELDAYREQATGN